MSGNFGLIVAPSSASSIKIIANASAAGTAIIGRSIYTIISLDDGEYLSMGTVTNITTNNRDASNLTEQENASRSYDEAEENRVHAGTLDVRVADVKLQATFRRGEGEEQWKQYGASLPTSPAAHARVKILDEDQIFQLVDRGEVCFVGHNYQSFTLSPYAPTKFSDASGAVHSAYFAKSGSGKTVFATNGISVNMRDHERNIMVVDPQGQWSSEEGFLYSVQAFAKGLGREVEIMRVSEDIQLPHEAELIEQMLALSGMWKKFAKMAGETRDLISTEFADDLVFSSSAFDKTPREAFTEFLSDMEKENSRLRKVYATDSKVLNLRNRMRELLHMPPVDANGLEILDEPESERKYAKMEKELNDIVNSFSPVHNMFSKTNMWGKKRHPLSGPYGKLTSVLKPHAGDTKPAPYIIFDMSQNSEQEGKAEFIKGVSGDDAALRMNALLGKDEVKTAILTNVFQEMTKIAEEAFNSGGNLNTEIVFDEAMRFAMPPGQAPNEIAKNFTENLAEYARDTRKFGIGWTYILQTPTGLNENIFKQLTNIYVGWGLSGKDLQMIGDQMDGKEYLDIYSSFAPPRATGRYPFMLLGINSPLIFTHTPAFVEVFTSVRDFFANNAHWMNELGTTHGRGTLTVDDMSLEAGKKLQASQRAESKAQRSVKEEKKESKPLTIGANRDDASSDAPKKKYNDWENITTDEDPPF